MGRLAALLLFLPACFNPEDPADQVTATDASTGSSGETSGTQNESTGTPSTGPTSGGTTEATTMDTEVSADSSSTTNAADAPPTVLVTVDRTDSPSPATDARRIALAADAADDVGVASVEFFLGEQSVGVDTEAPYELDAFVSSRENGSLQITARATDTSDQTTDSEPVTLEVDISGGQIVANDDAMGQTLILSATRPRLRVLPDGDVVAGMSRITDPDAPLETAVHMRRYPRDLGTPQWAVSNVVSIPAGEQGFVAIGRPAPRPGASELLIGGVAGNDTTIFPASANTGSFDDTILVSVDGESSASYGGLVVGSDGRVFVGGPGDLIARFDADLAPIDALPIGEAFGNGSIFWDLQIDGQDNLVFDIALCTESCSFLTTKASAEGDVLWSDALIYDDQPIALWAGATAVNDDRIASVVPSADGLSYVVRDSTDGSVIDEGDLSFGERYNPAGLAIDPQGLLVASAVSVNDDGTDVTASVVRFDPASGDVLWNEEVGFGGLSLAYDVVHGPDGRVFVTGLSGVTLTAFPTGALVAFGEAWIAAISP